MKRIALFIALAAFVVSGTLQAASTGSQVKVESLDKDKEKNKKESKSEKKQSKNSKKENCSKSCGKNEKKSCSSTPKQGS